jgi:MinD superfamily P-loop ATPase
MEDRHAVIDHCLCEDCHMCQYVCRNNVIKAMEVPEYIYQQRAALKAAEGGMNE